MMETRVPACHYYDIKILHYINVKRELLHKESKKNEEYFIFVKSEV